MVVILGGAGLALIIVSDPQRNAARPSQASAVQRLAVEPLTATRVVPTVAQEPDSLRELLALEPVERAKVDIARANLLVAKSTPGAGSIDVNAHLATLDAWAVRVASETDRHLYQFREKPDEFLNSEGYFRILMLVTVLQQDCGVRYNPERIDSPDFTDPGDLFIHGLIDGEGGTCVSMPVLYVAVARRLGYPVSLVTTKGHVFARWDGGGEWFNIEATSQGLNVYDDVHYRNWPHPLTDEDIRIAGYLRSLKPDEEIAAFLLASGHVFEDTGRLSLAIERYRLAARLDPERPQNLEFADRAAAMLALLRADYSSSRVRRPYGAHVVDIHEPHRRLMAEMRRQPALRTEQGGRQ